MRVLPAFALPLLLLASLAYADCPDPSDHSYLAVCGVDAFNCSSGGALDWIALAFMFVAVAISLTYMYSRLKEDPAAATWAKDEAANLAISVLLFAGILAFFTGSCAIAQEYSGANPFTASKTYLQALLQANGQGVLKELTSKSISEQMGATWYLYVGFTPFFGSGLAGRADLRAHSAEKEFLIDLYLPLVASLNAQLYLLQAIEWVSASVLLPFAFVMRLIPPTREFGNMLIALFFGLYIVVPTMYAMSGKVFMDIINPVLAPECVVCQMHNLFYSYKLDPDPTGFAFKDMYFYRIGSTLPQAVFLPNLVIVVTVATISALSKALRAFAV